MRKSELIKALNKFSKEDFEVCLFDWRKNCFYSDSEGTSEGIYNKFSVELTDNDSEHTNQKKFISLSFHNEDYTENGEKSEL